MSYALHIRRAAQEELAVLPVREFDRVEAAIKRLADDPRPVVVAS